MPKTPKAIKLPLSKSIVNRILVLEFVSGRNPANLYSGLDQELLCRDIVELEKALETIWRQKHQENHLTGNTPAEVTISEGAAPLRFFIAAAASSPGVEVVLNVSGRLAKRPITSLLDSLREMDGEITQTFTPEGYKLRISGKRLCASDFKLDTSQTSQFLSALMLVSPNINGWENVKIPESTVSSSYVYMTARLLANRDTDLLRFVEGDWSAAANFFICSLLFKKSLELEGLHEESLQGDSYISSLFKSLGGRVVAKENSLLLYPPEEEDNHSTKTEGIVCLPLGETPDIVPPVAVGLALAGIRYRLMGVDHLRHKESDRISVLISEMEKIGYLLRYSFGSLVWDGEISRCTSNNIIDPHNDHRIAMAFAPAERMGLCRIAEKGVVDKSYPGFWKDFDNLF